MLMKFVATSIVAAGLAMTGFATDNQTATSSANDCCKPDGTAECCLLELPCCDDQACCETGEDCCLEQAACCADSAPLTETVVASASSCCAPDGSAECCVLELPCCDDQTCCDTGGPCCELSLACCEK